MVLELGKVVPLTAVSPHEKVVIDGLIKDYDSASDDLQKIQKLQLLIKQLTRVAATKELFFTKRVGILCSELCKQLLKYTAKHPEERQKLTEDAAAVISQLFRITVSDHHTETPLKGRTVQCHKIACLLLQIYIHASAYALAEGILKAIRQYQPHIPPLSDADWHTKVQFSYYEAIILFRDLKFVECTEKLQFAISAAENGETLRLTTEQLTQIMRIYIPAQLIAFNRHPSKELMKLVPKLALYRVLTVECRRGNYTEYKRIIRKNETRLRELKVYLQFSACMIPLVRLNLLRRTWLVLNKPKRLPLSVYANALKLGGFEMHSIDAAQFYCAQFVANGEARGYIHPELKLLLLSSTQPFPTMVKAIEKKPATEQKITEKVDKK